MSVTMLMMQTDKTKRWLSCLFLSLIFNLNVKSVLCAIKVNKDQLCCYVTLGESSFRAGKLEKHLFSS